MLTVHITICSSDKSFQQLPDIIDGAGSVSAFPPDLECSFHEHDELSVVEPHGNHLSIWAETHRPRLAHIQLGHQTLQTDKL